MQATAISNIIETTALTRRFGTHTAVDNVELAVPTGAVYAFLGPNGAGKTTTIRMLLGLIRPTGGQVRLFGRQLVRPQWPVLARVGTLVEMPSLYPQLTGWENIEVLRRMLGFPREKIVEALRTVRLEKDAKRLVKHYSLGMKQRLGLAMALVNDPVLLILDEPTNGLDPSGIQEIRSLIREMPSSRGVTVFLSSHLLGEVEQIATHVGIISAGRLVYQGTLDALRKQRTSRLHLKVDRAEVALELITGLGYPVERSADGVLKVAVTGEDAQRISAALLGAAMGIREMAVHEPSLEELFLGLTNAGTPAPVLE